jgi:hypothetical protein
MNHIRGVSCEADLILERGLERGNEPGKRHIVKTTRNWASDVQRFEIDFLAPWAQAHSFTVQINVTSSNTADTKVSPIPSSHRFPFILLA